MMIMMEIIRLLRFSLTFVHDDEGGSNNEEGETFIRRKRDCESAATLTLVVVYLVGKVVVGVGLSRGLHL